ncbi:hypothetical protein, partial [Deinococcus aquaticus]|uniref:hypothetical protein n=1 Tax=Deinococcus aquaticus TaxID=328692 RepID=UPI003F48567C
MTTHQRAGLPTPRPEPVSLLLALLGLKAFANLSTGVTAQHDKHGKKRLFAFYMSIILILNLLWANQIIHIS